MPNRAAHTTCIVLSEHLSNHYVGPLIRGAIAAAAELGIRLILYSPLSIYMDRREFTLADLPLLPHQVDSYLLPANVAEEVVHSCRRSGAPLLTYAGARPGLPMIGPDNQAGARMATTHLIEHGRRRIVHLAGLPDSGEAQERMAGYREALEAAGITYDPALVIYGHFRIQEAEDAITQLLHHQIPFDAIFAANDLEARGAINILARAGIRIPEDVAIIGFDDAAGSDLLDPPLTTVRQSAFQLGWDALTLLIQTGEHSLPERTDTRVRLVVRQSCGCTPASNTTSDWAAALTERFGSGQAPLVDAQNVKTWTSALEETLDGAGDWIATIETTVDLIERSGGYAPALRDYLETWRARRIADGAAPLRAATIAGAAKDMLAALLESRTVQEMLERNSRLNAISYVIDLLREYRYEQSLEPVLRYMMHSGPLAAISAQRGATSDSITAQRVSSSGTEQWQGPATAFPPPTWLAPSETLLMMPVESGAQQRILFGVVEGTGRAHIELDDHLLRSINTYRSITVLNETLRELDAARSVQLSLLPRHAPASKHYDIAGATRAARQVGGDLYGYYVRSGGDLALAIGDVAGKGMPAALLMSACATALAGTIQNGLSPGRTLTQIHHMLQPSVNRVQNAAICLAYLNGPRVQIANAGSVAPIVRDRNGVRLVNVGGIPLGTPLSGLRPYAEAELYLAPGDLLILSSDGIVEAMNEAGELYGFERFLEAIANSPQENAQKILTYLFDQVIAFGGTAEMHDDMAIVVACYRG
jgi:LacI family transcriptional regulator